MTLWPSARFCPSILWLGVKILRICILVVHTIFFATGDAQLHFLTSPVMIWDVAQVSNCTSCFLYTIHIWDKSPSGRKRSSNRYGISEVHRIPKNHQARSLTQRKFEDRIPGRSWTWPCAPSTSHKSQCSLPKAPQEGHVLHMLVNNMHHQTF